MTVMQSDASIFSAHDARAALIKKSRLHKRGILVFNAFFKTDQNNSLLIYRTLGSVLGFLN